MHDLERKLLSVKVPAEMQKMYLVGLLCKPQRWPRAHIQHAFVAVLIHYYPSSIYAVLEFLRCVQLQIRSGEPELVPVSQTMNYNAGMPNA